MCGIEKEKKKKRRREGRWKKEELFLFPIFHDGNLPNKDSQQKIRHVLLCTDNQKLFLHFPTTKVDHFCLILIKNKGIFITINRNESKYLHLID